MFSKFGMMLAIAISLCTIGGNEALEVQSLYTRVVRDEENLHRNIISLNLLPKKLPIDKQSLLETKLKIQLIEKLWIHKDQEIGTESLALYIQALLATCIDPFDFYGLDLVHMLKNDISGPKNQTLTPFEEHLASLTLCILSRDANHFQQLIGSERQEKLSSRNSATLDKSRNLHSHFHSQTPEQMREADEKNMDDRLVKALTLSCYAKLVPQDSDVRFKLNELMASVFVRQNQTDGSFNGSVVTTSLAIQSFIESGLDRLAFLWDRRKAVYYINNSFKNMEITSVLAYFVVPAFHRTWREIKCRSHDHQEDEESEIAYAKSWTRALNQVLNQADSSVNVTLSRWVYGASGEKTKVSVNIPPGNTLLRALKDAVKSSTSFNYTPLFPGTVNQTSGTDTPYKSSAKKESSASEASGAGEVDRDTKRTNSFARLLRSLME